MAKQKAPLEIGQWAARGVYDARNGAYTYPKDISNRWIQQENRLAYKEAYDRECALLLITRGAT